jgi:hypothetical protein
MKTPPRALIDKLVELVEQNFPGLYISSGWVCERSDWHFTNVENMIAGKVETGPLVETFRDADGNDWRGRPGAYDLVPFEDEFEVETRSETSFNPCTKENRTIERFNLTRRERSCRFSHMEYPTL